VGLASMGPPLVNGGNKRCEALVTLLARLQWGRR